MRGLVRNTPLLALLLVVVVAVPISGQGIVVSEPDRRAIPMLVSRSRTLLNYGTGVVVGSNTILTAGHVIAGPMEVNLPAGTVAGHPICRARYEDLAVVKAPLPKGTPYYRLSFRKAVVGETVKVGGYPNRKWSVTSGRITYLINSAILGGRHVRAPMIVFRPALHHGASGSPLLDRQGQVIGIFVASNPQANYSIAFPTGTGLRTCSKFVK